MQAGKSQTQNQELTPVPLRVFRTVISVRSQWKSPWPAKVMRLRAQNPRERELGSHSPVSRHDPYVIKGQGSGAHPSDWILLGYTDSPPQPLTPPEQLSCSSVICVGKEAVGVHHGLRSGIIMVPGVVGHYLQGGIVPSQRPKQIRLTKGVACSGQLMFT